MKRFIIAGLILSLVVGAAYAIERVSILPLTIGIVNNTTTVGTNPTALPATALAGRESIAIRLQTTTDTVYLGDSSVTTANGFTLDSSVPAVTIDIDDSVIIYGIVSAGTADVRTLEAK